MMTQSVQWDLLDGLSKPQLYGMQSVAKSASHYISRNGTTPRGSIRVSLVEMNERDYNASLCSCISTGVKAQLALFVGAPGEEEAVRGEGCGMRISCSQLSYRHGPQGLQEDWQAAVCPVCYSQLPVKIASPGVHLQACPAKLTADLLLMPCSRAVGLAWKLLKPRFHQMYEVRHFLRNEWKRWRDAFDVA